MNLYNTTKNASVSPKALNDALYENYQATLNHFQQLTKLKGNETQTPRFKEGQTLKNARMHYAGFLYHYHVNAYKQKQVKLIDFALEEAVQACFMRYKHEQVILYMIDELHGKTYEISAPNQAKIFTDQNALITSAPNKNNHLVFYEKAMVLYDDYQHVKAIFDYKELTLDKAIHQVNVNAKKKKEVMYEQYHYVSLEVHGYSVSFLSQNADFVQAFTQTLMQAKNKAKSLYLTFDDYQQDAFSLIYGLLTTDYTSRFFMKALLANVHPETLVYTFYPIKERLFDTLNHLALNQVIALTKDAIELLVPSSVFEHALMKAKENQFMKAGDLGWT